MSAIGSRNGPGYGSRYDRYEPNAAQDQQVRNANYRPGIRAVAHFQKRFCETCQSSKPKGKRPAVKGWKCDDCLKGR